jgi:carbon-monoxide dehydrogenase iron sulfur subunit
VKKIRIDRRLCTGCEACNFACSFAHTGLFDLKRGCIHFEGNRMYIGNPIACQQCKNAKCASVCPVEAFRHTEQLVELDREKCIGCGECVRVCPFHAVFIDHADDKARKCDLCKGDPVCVKYCQKQAVKLVEF